jgi:ketosteroid isomerase-like protein
MDRDTEVDLDAVQAVNRTFYDAFETRDLVALDATWEHSDRVTCVHPGWPILRGWDEVRDSWARIIGGPGRLQFILTNDVAVVAGDIAWITVDENLISPAGDGGTVAATNLFARQDDGRWLLVGHHGSPVQASSV